ncbi:hypothetical protein QR680_004013 [Steinernema hermaphroditum]|uniref:Uncharacterized protein n=1 Tax=Steinernema hermaphroditum TaxID=289476 RepID=A0AA39HMC9_9BILA|nr:hypothetical protein QR680_004013 [Steinernema hermaphroditum]
MPYIAGIIDTHLVWEPFSFTDYYLGYPVTVLSILLIYLSLRLRPPFLSRMYCLNVAIPSFCYAFLSVFPDVVKGIGLKSVWTIVVGPSTSIRVYLRYYAICSYPYFSTLTIFLAYLGHAKPFFFQKITKQRHITAMVGFLHLWTTISVLLFLPRDVQSVYLDTLKISKETDFSIIAIAFTVINLACYVLMTVLYVLALIQIVNRTNNTNSPSAASHRNVLKSVLIYCTAPNFFCAFALSGYFCLTIFEVQGFLKPSHWKSPREISHWIQSESFCGPVLLTTETLASKMPFIAGVIEVHLVPVLISKTDYYLGYPAVILNTMPYIATVIDIHMVPDFINRMDYGFGYPVVILSALLVFLSLKLDPPFLCKMYCLNVAVPSFFYSFVFLFPDIIKSMGLKSVWEILIGPATSIRVHLRYYALCNYPYFSTLTIFLAYLGYAKPMFFRKLIKRRNITLMVGAIHLWTLLSVFFFLPREITIFYYKMSESDFSAVTIVHTFIVLSCSVFMSAVYILAIIEMLRHANGDSASAIGHRNTLKSVLIYCTAPNFFCAFALSGYICLTVFEVKGYLRPSHWRSPSDVSHWVLSEKFCGPVVTTTETLGSSAMPFIAGIIDTHLVWEPFSFIDYYLGYPVTVLSALVIYLSLRLDPPFLPRMYCLNVAIPNLCYSFLSVFPDDLKGVGLKSAWEIIIGPVTLLRTYLRYFALCSYPYFSTLTIFLAYVGYAKPVFFRNITRTR